MPRAPFAWFEHPLLRLRNLTRDLQGSETKSAELTLPKEVTIEGSKKGSFLLTTTGQALTLGKGAVLKVARCIMPVCLPSTSVYR